MAGIGIGQEEFAVFEIDDPDRRAAALEARVLPRLESLGEGIAAGLSRVAGKRLHPHCPGVRHRRGTAPVELFVAFSENPRGLGGQPFLAVAVSRGQLHARVAVRGESPRTGAMRRAVAREAANLARKGKPFRKLRQYLRWDGQELPEIAPAHSAAFWEEVAMELGPSGRRAGSFDLGVAWSGEEARSLAVGDLLGAFRDLAPLYKLLANAT
ncbi:MAG TPA: DUF1054 family protein [Anaeromyxobacteraceae bacterium]|nr:DUF1054 family protein [Anaeromyxobacteraceae bacterium]